MKYFIAIALIAAVASAKAIIKPADLHGLSESQMHEVQQILEAINSPSTDPTTAAMLEEMLLSLLGLSPVKPPAPVIVDEFEPVHIGPEIVEETQPIDVSPEIVDFPVIDGVVVPAPAPEAPQAPQAPSGSPIIQIIVNVNPDGTLAGSPVQVDHVAVEPSPVVVVDEPQVAPTPVQVVDEPQAAPTPVQVVDQAPQPEPVIVSPIVVAPVVVGPDTLN